VYESDLDQHNYRLDAPRRADSHHGRRRRGPRWDRVIVMLIVAVVAAALIYFVARALTHQNTRTFTNAQWGISLKLDNRLSKANGMSLAPLSRTIVLYSAGFYNRDGARVNGRLVDGVEAAVLQSGSEFKPEDLGPLKDVVGKMLWPASLPPHNPFGGSPSPSPSVSTGPAKPTPALNTVTINSMPGFVSDIYQQTMSGTAFKVRAYVLFKGERYYMLWEQARADHWNSIAPVLDKAVQSFRAQ
jgi:hypothetical protein